MVEIVTLDNGLRVICDPMPTLSSIAMGMWVGAGTLDETPTEAGIAHLLEHMAFKGTTTRSARDIAIELENVGGSLDAATSHQRTGYYGRFLKEDLNHVSAILADILMQPVFDEAELEREKEVVIQEIGEAADDPDDGVFETLSRLAWGDHPLGHPILGSIKSVRQHSRDNLLQFMNRLYCAPNMVLAASGGIDPDMLYQLAQDHYGGLKPHLAISNNKDKNNRTRPIYKGGRYHDPKPLEQTHIAIAYPGYGYDDERYLAARLFSDVFGGGMSSRLFQKIREEHGLAYSVYAFSDSFDQAGLIGAYIGTDEGQAEKASLLVANELKAMADKVHMAELDRAKALLRSSLLMGMESPAARIESASAQLMTFGEYRNPDLILERIMAVTPDDLMTIAQEIITTNALSLSVTGPLCGATAIDKLWAAFDG